MDESNSTRALPIHLTAPDLIPTALRRGRDAGGRAAGRGVLDGAEPGRRRGRAGLDRRRLFFPPGRRGTQRTPPSSISLILSQAWLPGKLQPDTVRRDAAVAPGDYYLIVRVDTTRVFESNEANNARSLPIRLTAPDLTPMALSVASTRVANRPVEVSWTVLNQGNGEGMPAPEWWDAVGLSTDPVGDMTDIVLTGTLIRGRHWLPGGSYTRTRTVWMPEVAPGDYYLIVYTDIPPWDPWVFGCRSGRDEQWAGARHPPHRAGPNAHGPGPAATPIAGRSVGLSWTVQNQGDGEAGPAQYTGWSDALYFSSDPVWDATDTVLVPYVGHSGPGLVAGASYSQTLSVGMPSVAPGNYFLIVRMDFYQQVFEANDRTTFERLNRLTAPT